MTIKANVYGGGDYSVGIMPVYTEIDTKVEEIEPESIKDVVLKLSELFGDLWDTSIKISFSHQPRLIYRRVYTAKGEVLVHVEAQADFELNTVYFA